MHVSINDDLAANRQGDIDAHNRFQRDYCENAISRTIVPRQSRHLRRQLDETMRVAGISSADRVLEVGCGMGRFTLMLAERGVHVEGLDLSPGLLDRLRAYGGERFDIPLHCADALEPPAALRDAFDVVAGVFRPPPSQGPERGRCGDVADAETGRAAGASGRQWLEPAVLSSDAADAGHDLARRQGHGADEAGGRLRRDAKCRA